MTEPGRHKCPDCGNDMVKISSQNETLGRNEKVWDLAHTGVGTTIASTTSGANYSGVSCPQEGSSYRRDIFLVPYECPVCHYKESYRE
jgi:ssDNA-binding Zn-finger/Zn-ribbon topoisomerase 1